MVRKREFRGRKGVNITMEPCLKYIIYTYKIVKEIVKVKLTRPINTSKFTSTEQKKKNYKSYSISGVFICCLFK